MQKSSNSAQSEIYTCKYLLEKKKSFNSVIRVSTHKGNKPEKIKRRKTVKIRKHQGNRKQHTKLNLILKELVIGPQQD